MKLFAIDTATDVCSIAIADENGVIAEYNFAHRMDLSRRLMSNISNMLKDFELEPKDLDGIGISLGPGSFTGLRIGVTTAKTLAHVLNLPIAGVVSLDLLAHQFEFAPDEIICPLIKVRKGEEYFAFYEVKNGIIERVSEYKAAPVSDVISAAEVYQSKRIIFCGDALLENADIIQQNLGDRAVIANKWLSYPKASILARLAIERISEGQAENPLTLAPFYIRRSAPEMRAENA